MTYEQTAELERIADELQPALMIKDLTRRLQEAKIRERNWDSLYTVACDRLQQAEKERDKARQAYQDQVQSESNRIRDLEEAARAVMEYKLDTPAWKYLAEVLEAKCTNS